MRGFRCFYSHTSHLCSPKQLLTFSFQEIGTKPLTPNKILKMENAGFLKIGNYHVFPWSISGVESCIVVRSDDLFLTFDMGYSHRQSVASKHVFFSHGHIDHIGCLPQHAMKRALYGMKPATYYMPSNIVNKVRDIALLYHQVHDSDDSNVLTENLHIKPVDVGEQIELSGNFFVQSFETYHRIKSQGYIVYKRTKKLKEEYKHLTGKEIGERVRAGEEVSDIETTPEIAYTGDTTFEVYDRLSNPDLLKVKLLITESTYIDTDPNKDIIEQARQRGHTHLQEIIKNEELFSNVGAICLVHFSDKYSPGFIHRTMNNLPPRLRSKIYFSTIAKENS